MTDIGRSALWAAVILLAAGIASATTGWLVAATDADPWNSPAITVLEYFWSFHLLLLDATGMLSLPVETGLQALVWTGAVAAVWPGRSSAIWPGSVTEKRRNTQ